MRTNTPTQERGEGNLRLVIALALMAYIGYVGVKNVPIYLDVQNLKYDVEEVARTNGAQGIALEKVQPQVTKLAQKYLLDPKELSVKQSGPNLTVSVSTQKELDFLFTTYVWHINHAYTGTRL